MANDNFFFSYICIYMIPLIMAITGLVYRSHPPKHPKGDALALSGYKSHMSMLSEETWKTAHKCIGLLWTLLGPILLVLTYLSRHWLFAQNNFSSALLLLLFFQCFVLFVLPILITEIRLRLLFDANGERK